MSTINYIYTYQPTTTTEYVIIIKPIFTINVHQIFHCSVIILNLSIEKKMTIVVVFRLLPTHFLNVISTSQQLTNKANQQEVNGQGDPTRVDELDKHILNQCIVQEIINIIRNYITISLLYNFLIQHDKHLKF